MLNPNRMLKNIVETAVLQASTNLVARAFMAYIFIVAGWGKIAGYEATVGYMQAIGVSGE